MELFLWSVLFFSVCVHNSFAQSFYDTYELESFSLCADEKEEGTVYIRPWRSIILKVGHKVGKDGTRLSQKLHRCKVKIKTQDEFGLVAVIEDMKLQGKRNRDNGWECQGDYVKISTIGSSTFAKIMDTILPGDLFKKKATEELCGTRHSEGQRFSEVGSSANALSTLSNNLQVEYHQKQNVRHFVNNSFTIIITTFRRQGSEVFADLCNQRYVCPGSNSYCIHPDYICDGHYNCAFPSGGGDEFNCPVPGVSYQPMFSATTLIIMTLGSIVGVGLVVCCLFTIFMRTKSRTTTPTGTPIPPPLEASAPPVERQNTLPCYEAVVMSDIEDEQKISVPPSAEVREYPPSYDQLYPDGPPPKAQGHENSI